MSLKVLIGGGTGFIGQVLTKLLRERGHSVLIVSRSGTGKNIISWDTIQEKGLPTGINAVVNLTGKNIGDPMARWNKNFKQEIYDSRIKPILCLKEAMLSSEVRPQSWTSISGVGYYATSATASYDENSKGGKSGYLVELAREWEGASTLPDYCKEIRHTIIRSGVVLGKDGGVVKNMIWPFWFGLGGPLGTGKQYFPWIHINDLAGIFVHAIENSNVSGVLNAVAPASDTNEDFTRSLAAALHRPALFRIPEFAVKLLFGDDVASVLLEGQNVSPSRTLVSGYKFLYPELKQALHEIIK